MSDGKDDTTIRGGMLLFWGGPFSQWAQSPFIIDGNSYSCAEQWMMAEKARLFGDAERLEKIMAATHPKAHKEHGRKVAGFDKEKWDSVARDVVFKGNVAKFTQNPEFGTRLRAAKGLTIVEASPYDTIWGVGLGVDDPNITDPSKWRGKNWLGFTLMKVRDALLGVT